MTNRETNHNFEIMKSNAILLLGAVLLALAPGAYAITEAPTRLPSTAAEPAGGFTGKVIETTNATRYTYILVDTGKEKIWAAAPRFPVKTGDQVKVAPGVPMNHFESKALNRTFDTVYFTDRVTVAGASQPAAKSLEEAHASVPGFPLSTPPPHLDFAGLKKPEDGCTVAETYALKAKLANKTVLVRGKVVKYNGKIMKKNWLHIRDGTGDAGVNDLAITTTDTAKVGDTVLVRGTLALDRDFGYGYKYDLILENSKVTVEAPPKP
jgi:hypothetical protein